MRRDTVGSVTGDSVRGSRPENAPGRRLKDRAVHEARRFVFIFLYLFILFGLFTIHEAIILEQHHIDYTYAGFALVNALILAKVMLVAEDLRLGRRFEDRPLIYPVLFKSVLFAILFICFRVIENVLTGLWDGKTVLESLPGIGGGGIKGVVSVAIIETFALIPFFAFAEISRVLGAAALQTLIFRRGPKDVIIEFKLRVQEGE
jgi:hypothetical protein